MPLPQCLPLLCVTTGLNCYKSDMQRARIITGLGKRLRSAALSAPAAHATRCPGARVGERRREARETGDGVTPHACPNPISRYLLSPYPQYQDIRPHTWAPKSAKLARSYPVFHLCHHASNFLRYWALLIRHTWALMVYYVAKKHAAACDRPVGPHMVAYGP